MSRERDQARPDTAERARFWPGVLEEHWVGAGNRSLCGDAITIADFLDAGPRTAGELIGNKSDR